MFFVDDSNFKQRLNARLITSFDELVKIVEPLENKYIAFDTETTGLSPYKDRIVGMSFATGSYEGYYIPLRHWNESLNLPVKETFDLFYKKVLKRNKILLYNATFDLLMYEAEGYKDLEKLKYFDVMNLVYLSDSDSREKGLKEASKRFLNRESPTFESVVKNLTFDKIDPNQGYYYAVCDAVNTYALYSFLFPILSKECPFIVKLDTELSHAILHYAKNKVYVDTEKMKVLKEELEIEISNIDRKIFKLAGFPFKVMSNKETSMALSYLGIFTGKLTKTNDMALGEKYLSKIDHPICKAIIERRSLTKQLTTYVLNLCNKEEGYVNFKTTSTATGRLSSGSSGEEKGSYYLPINFQNLTKSKVIMYEAVKSDDVEKSILGYEFTPVDSEYIENNPDKFFVEGFSQNLNIRNAITVPNRKDWYFVSIDYSMQELKVAGIMSGEPNLIEPFKHNKDLHKETAIKIWGEENYTKDRRKEAKSANFGLLYGGTAKTLEESTGRPYHECEQIYNDYVNLMSKLYEWKKKCISFGYAYGSTYTYFKRPRRVYRFLSDENPSMKRFGERAIISHKIQGTCGDIMRIKLVQLYKRIFSNKKTYSEIRFVGTVHDEIIFLIRKSNFNYWIDKLIDIMKFNKDDLQELNYKGKEDWMLELDNTVEVGYSYGYMFNFKKDKNGIWKPS